MPLLATFEQVKTVTATLIDWWRGGSQEVADEEVVRRSKICARGGVFGGACKFNMPAFGCDCSGKQSVDKLLALVIGGKPSQYDGELAACHICGCSLKAKVRLPMDVLAKNDSKIFSDAYPEWCWMSSKL